MQSGFVAVSLATQHWGLQRLDPWHVCVYPDEETWWHLQRRAPELRRLLVATLSGRFAFYGPPGTGKTFQFLLLGNKWIAEHSGVGAVAGKSLGCLAFYAPTSKVDVGRTKEHWHQLKNYQVLWLLDDSHEAPEVADALLAAFADMEMAERGHSLGIAGRAELLDAAVETLVSAQITPDLIEAALIAKSHRVPSKSTLSRLARASIGLRQILQVARDHPARLEDVNFVQEHWARDALSGISESASTHLLLLCRLQLLSLPHQIIGVQDLAVQQELFAKGLCREPGAASGARLVDDEQAISFLRTTYRSSDMKAADFYVQPLSAYLRDLFRADLSRQAIVTLEGLARAPSLNLRDWLGPALIDPTVGNMVESLASHSTALQDLVRATQSQPALSGRALACALSLHIASSSTQPTAEALLVREIERIESNLSLFDAPSWTIAATLARRLRKPKLRFRLARIISQKGMDLEIAKLSTTHFWPLIRETTRLPGRYSESVLDKVVPRYLLRPENESGSTLLAAIAKFAQFEEHLAILALKNVPRDRLGKAVLSRPHDLERLEANCTADSLEKVDRFLLLALTAVAIDDQTAEGWTPKDVIALVRFAVRFNLVDVLKSRHLHSAAGRIVNLENSNAVSALVQVLAPTGDIARDLRFTVARELEDALLTRRDPHQARMFALARLDHRRARGITLRLLKSPVFQTAEAWECFPLLWISQIILAPRDYKHLHAPCEQLTLRLRGGELDKSSRYLREAIAGLCSFILGGPPVAEAGELRPGERAPTSAITWAGLACRLYFLSRVIQREQSNQISELQTLLGSLRSPTLDLHSRWRDFYPNRAKRRTLHIIVRAFENLAVRLPDLRPTLSDLLEMVELDDFWDAEMALRLRGVQMLHDQTAAAALLSRRREKWVQNLGYQDTHDALHLYRAALGVSAIGDRALLETFRLLVNDARRREDMDIQLKAAMTQRLEDLETQFQIPIAERTKRSGDQRGVKD